MKQLGLVLCGLLGVNPSQEFGPSDALSSVKPSLKPLSFGSLDLASASLPSHADSLIDSSIPVDSPSSFPGFSPPSSELSKPLSFVDSSIPVDPSSSFPVLSPSSGELSKPLSFRSLGGHVPSSPPRSPEALYSDETPLSSFSESHPPLPARSPPQPEPFSSLADPLESQTFSIHGVDERPSFQPLSLGSLEPPQSAHSLPQYPPDDDESLLPALDEALASPPPSSTPPLSFFPPLSAPPLSSSVPLPPPRLSQDRKPVAFPAIHDTNIPASLPILRPLDAPLYVPDSIPSVGRSLEEEGNVRLPPPSDQIKALNDNSPIIPPSTPLSAHPVFETKTPHPEEVGFMTIDPTNFEEMSLPEKIRHFEVEGYVVFPGILSNDTIGRIKRELADAEMAPTSYSESQTRSTVQPQWLSPAVAELVGFPPIVEFLTRLLGPDIVFTRGFYQKTLFGSPGISLHTDGQPHGSNLFGFEGSSPRLLRVLYYLDELTPERGPFRLVPRSHLSFHADASPYLRYKSHPEEITLLLPAGSAVIVPSLVFHGSHAQKDPSPRELVQLGYRPGWAGPIQLVDEWDPNLLATIPPTSRPFFQSPNKSGFQWEQPHKPAGMRSDSEGIRPSRWLKDVKKEELNTLLESESKSFGRKAFHGEL